MKFIFFWPKDKALQDRPLNGHKSLFGFETEFVAKIKNVQKAKYGLMVL
jgi:hypothetical protein